MIDIVPFQLRHLDDVIRRDSTGEYGKMLGEGYFDNIEYRIAYSAVNENGEAVAIAGLSHYGCDRHEAFALLTTKTWQEFLAVHRATKKFLGTCMGRVECVVRRDFPEGKRWAESLGFHFESVMLDFFGREKDAIMYVIRRWE